MACSGIRRSLRSWMRRHADEESGRQQPGWAGATVAFTLGSSAGTSGGCALLKAACGYGIGPRSLSKCIYFRGEASGPGQAARSPCPPGMLQPRQMAKQHVRRWRVSGPMADIAKSTRLTRSGHMSLRLSAEIWICVGRKARFFQKGHSKANTLRRGKPRPDAFKVIAVDEHRGGWQAEFHAALGYAYRPSPAPKRSTWSAR
jgi:hypothetical protein